MINWHLEKRKLKDLKAHPKNPRQMSKEQENQLINSIEKFGLSEKLILNTDNMVIGGHQRLRVLKKLGHTEIDCWIPDQTLDEKQVDELNIRLNRNHGSFDYDILANEFNFEDLAQWGFTSTELEMTNIDEVFKDSEEIPKKKKKECPNCGHEF